MVNHDVDILIVGGGLIGAVLHTALASSGFKTLLIDAGAGPSQITHAFDSRSLALSPASLRILKTLDIWSSIQSKATDIDTIHISEKGCFGHTLLKRDGAEPLGCVIELHDLHQALHQKLDPKQCMMHTTLVDFDLNTRKATVRQHDQTFTICANIIIAADGSDSSLRHYCGLSANVKTYPNQALIANIELARDHQHQAFERFTSEGPMALLPMTQRRVALVWSLTPEHALQSMAASDAAFLNHAQTIFGYRLGRFIKVGRRQIYPLRQVIMPTPVKGPVVFIGNAAHTLHPVAGQGFNLGLRDVARLAQCLMHQGLHATTLQHYQTLQQTDQTSMRQWIDRLLAVFANTLPGASLLRGLGLLAVDQLPWLKQSIVHYASGLSGVASDLVCGRPLERRS